MLDDTIVDKIVKGKGKTAANMEKQEMCREARQGIDWQL